MILTTPVRLNNTDFSVKKTLYMGLENIEDILDIRFMFDDVDPAMATKIINETDIIFVSTR
jgi:hypothetical protein